MVIKIGLQDIFATVEIDLFLEILKLDTQKAHQGNVFC